MSNNKKNTLYRYSRYIKLIFLICDIILLNITFIFSYLIRFGNFERIYKQDSQSIFMLSNIIWIVLSAYLGAYKFVRVEHIEKIISRTIKLIFLHLVILFSIILILKFEDISRFRMLIFYGLLFISIFSFRLIFIQLLKKLRKSGYNFRTVIIIGANKTGFEINRLLSKDLSYGYRVLGYFDDTEEQLPNDIQLLGKIADVKEFITSNSVHEVYYAGDDNKISTIVDIIKFCENNLIRIKIAPHFQKYTDSRRVHIDFYDNTPILSLRKEPLEIPLNRILKKIVDFGIALTVLLLIAPWLFLILIIMVKLSSKGPVFFKQQRSGLGNISFWCYKFRTMKVNSLSDSKQATKEDKRITKVGAFLRKSNLDELPQILNVLKGEMSIVGPRPHMIKHTEEYSALIDNYLVRHFAKPGITGWAQVNGFRGETKELKQMEGRIEFDIFYIENWSLLLDIKIIILTIFNMFKGDKNAF